MTVVQPHPDHDQNPHQSPVAVRNVQTFPSEPHAWYMSGRTPSPAAAGAGRKMLRSILAANNASLSSGKMRASLLANALNAASSPSRFGSSLGRPIIFALPPR